VAHISVHPDVAGKISEPLNQRVEALLFNPQKNLCQFPPSAIEPEALLINEFDFHSSTQQNFG